MNAYYVQAHLYREQERQSPSSNEAGIQMGDIINK